MPEIEAHRLQNVRDRLSKVGGILSAAGFRAGIRPIDDADLEQRQRTIEEQAEEVQEIIHELINMEFGG